MESEEGPADVQAGHEADEVMEQENQAEELNKELLPSETGGELGGPVEAPVREDSLVLVDEEQPGEMLDSLVEVKNTGEESEVEELGVPNRPETDVLMSPDERESEGDTGEQIDQGHVSVPEEEMLVGEGVYDQEEKHDGDAEEESQKEEGQSLHGGEEEEISDQQDATLGVDEVSESEQREIEGESGEDMSESVTDQEVAGKLLEEGYEDMGEMQEEEGEEVPDADERELEKGALEGVIDEGQAEADELVEVQQAEMHVLTENEVGEAALGHAEDEVLVESSEEMTILDKEVVASGVNQGKRGSEVYQREVESMPTEEDAAAGYGQEESEGLIGASRSETGQVNGKEDMAPFVSQGKALEDQESLKEAESQVPTAVGQRDTEDLPGATQGEVGQITNDVAPAVDQGQECSEDLTKTQSRGVAEREAAVAEEVVPLGRASKTQISEEGGKEDVILVLGQMEACETRGTDHEEGYRDVVLGENQGKAEELLEASEDLLEEVVSSIVDSALAMVEEEAGTSVGIGEGVPGKGSMSQMGVHRELREGTSRAEVTLAADQQVAPEAAGPQERIPGAQEEAPKRGVEEISAQDQDEAGKEKIKPRISQEVGELSAPEEAVAEDQRGLDQGERKQLESTGTFPGELSAEGRVASTEGQQGAKEFVVLYQDQTVTDVTEKAPSQYQQDVGKGKVPSQEKTLAWSSELDDTMARSSLGMAEEQDRPESSVERRSVGDQEPPRRGKGKRIKGLAGLRQGPILTVPRRGIQSAGGIGGVLEHVAPGLIVTSLTAQAEQKGLVKWDQKPLSRGALEQRATRSAEPGLHRPRAEVGERVVLMGYRIGREGMSSFSEAGNRAAVLQQVSGQEAAAFQQAGEASDVGKRSDREQTESTEQEEELKEEKPPGSQVAGLEGQCLEELQLAWLGRPLSRGYAASQPASGWSAGLGPGHGLAPGSLRAAIKERIDMMVIGRGVSKSAGQSPEPPDPFGTGGGMSGLAGKPENVHWLQEVLRSSRRASPLSVAGHSPYSKDGSPESTAGRRSPGLITGNRELKDWRDGVMGIAIKRYNAMRRAMWGEGPFGLHVKGRKVTGSSDRLPAGSFHTGTILDQVEQKMRKLARHVAAENMPELEVDGQRITDRLEQSMQLAGAEQGRRNNLPQESETLEEQSGKQEGFSAHTAYSDTGSPERRLGCQGTQELDGSSQWLADQNEAASQHALEQEASTATATEAFGTRGKEQERIKMQSSPHRPHSTTLHAQTAADRMTGSNPVSPASSGSPGSSGSLTPPHLTHDSSLDSHLSFDVPKMQTRALVSPGMYTSPDPVSMWDKTHAEIAEQAKHEAEIENRIAEMKKEGFWSLKRLSKVPEPVRPKVHWDYLCEEMQWLSADFAQERRWKRGVARKVVRMVIRHHEEQKQKEERAKREEQAKLRRIASSIAKEVKQFWSNVEKVVQFKQQSRLEEKRKKALDLQLDFIVGQTEKYSDLLTQSLNETLPVPSKAGGSHEDSAASSPPPPVPLIEDEDGDFQPHEESDDEETIEVEEQQEGNDSESRQREIELLMQESELPLEELLQSLPSQLLENSCNVSPCASSSDNEEEEEEEEESDSEEEEEEEGEGRTTKNLKPDKPKPVTQRNKKPWKPDEEDAEFTANEEEAEDEEETIDAEEKLEGDVDHSKELDDLAKEGELPMDELLQKYAGAYASDFEAEESEASTSEYEVESEDDDSSRHSDATEEVESEQEESEEEDGLEEEETSVSQEEDFGVEYLLKQDEDRSGEGDNDAAPAPGPKKEITDIAAAAESLQPKGYTLATTQVKTPIPCLLRGTLREYQHIGLDWLVTMYEKKLNGILADEMGLGKTIQTISLLAHLACEKGSWGPHLIIVPTSVILNWEMEIKRWCPSFKILTYYGAQKERKLKRQGWTKPNAFHICITSYKLVLQDHQAFRRKNWKYLILDEAQNIKNFKSQRWQSLLNFNSQRRLLLTGTPLQNSLMELWSLMHFLMPHVFQSHREFKEWFSNPLTGMIEGSQEYNENLVKRLHKVLRPFLLRRVKVDVEKQMPKKYEHVIKCRLSKRQRYLYDDFMAQAATKETLATGHFMSVINILMQLRKVCNHPNLFDPRPIHSPFITEGICFRTASLVLHVLDDDPFKRVDLGLFDLINLEGRVSRYETDTFLPKWKVTRKLIEEIAESPDPPPRPKPVKMKVNRMLQPMPKPENRTVVLVNSPRPMAPLQRPMAASMVPEPLPPALAPIQHPGSVMPGPGPPPPLPPPAPLPVSVSLPLPIPMATSPVTMSIAVPPATRPQTQTLVPTLSQNNTPAALLHGQASAPPQVLPMTMTATQLVPTAPRPLLPPTPIASTTTTSCLKPILAPMGQPQPVGGTLGMAPATEQPQPQQPLGTLAIAPLGVQQPISALGFSPVGQQQLPTSTLGVAPVGQPPPLPPPPPTNTLGPVPTTQQPGSAIGTATVGGTMKPMSIHSAVPALPGYNFTTTAGPVQQRLLLPPDMQARLPSGEVVSIGQLASLANRPLQSAPGSKPLTFQIQGNKLTLTGTQVRQVTMPQPARQLPRNVVHLVSAGGQHHIISQPAQVALIQAMAQQAGQAPLGVQAVPGHQAPTILPVPAVSTAAAAAAVASTTAISVPIAATQVPSSAVNSSGVVKIVVRQAPRDGLVSPSPGPQQPPLRPATATTATTLPGLPTALVAQRAPLPVSPVPPVRLPAQPAVPMRNTAPVPLQALVRPMLRMVPAPSPGLEQQLVTASPPPSATPFAITPAATVSAVALSASPSVAVQATSSLAPKEEPEILMLRSTTPTPPPPSLLAPRPRRQPPPPPRSPFYLESLEEKRKKQKEERLDRLFRLNEQHCHLAPIYGTEVLRFCTLFPPVAPLRRRQEEEEEGEEGTQEPARAAPAEGEPKKGARGAGFAHCHAAQAQRDRHRLEAYWQRSESLARAILTPQQRIEELTDIIERFIFAMPPVEAPAIAMHTSHPPPSLLLQQAVFKETLRQELSPHAGCLHRIVCNMRTQFPDLRLIQYDCGKLQTLDILLRQLKAGAHRVLIFTQMTRMLDVLEQFLNYHGHIYLRLDGSTRVEQRQALMERFNADKRIFCFILSTRSGGVGVNLTGADTVVFYDSDWNPTMDAQAQDRCHRIGQTRDVHIYRLISERTVEENILKKANQKRMLGDMAIEGGNFTTAYFKQQTIRELFDMPLDEPAKKEGEAPVAVPEDDEDPLATKQTQILEQALCKAEDPEDIRAATKAKAEQVAELAEFNENIPLDVDDRPSKEEEEEMSKAEQEIASLVEQLTPIERYAMNFLEASLEDISREELKQAEEQVEAARKDIDQAKDEVVFKLPEDEDESYLMEEGSTKKSKKGKGANRLAAERTGTRMSERLRNTRLPPRDGSSGDGEAPQARLPNLRHPRAVTDEDEDSLPQVAQHTRGAAVRREMGREEKSAQLFTNTRRAGARREEPWAKAASTGEKVPKIAPHRTEASPAGDRVWRANPHKAEAPSVGDKLLQGTPQKPDPGASGDRIQKSSPPKTEAQLAGDNRLRPSTQQPADSGSDKAQKGGPQKPEKPPGLVNLPPSSPRYDAPISDAQVSQLQADALDGKVPKLKPAAVSQGQEGTPQLCLPVPELQTTKNVPQVQVPASQSQGGGLVTAKLLDTETVSDIEKALAGIPAPKEKVPNPVPLVAAQELPGESKREEGACEVDLPLREPKEALPRPGQETEIRASSSAAQPETLNSLDEARSPQAVRETINVGCADKVAMETLPCRSSEDLLPQATDGDASTSDDQAPPREMPVPGCPEHSTPTAANPLLQLESRALAKEPNGPEQPPKPGDLPCPLPGSPEEISPRRVALPTAEAAASGEADSSRESPKRGQGLAENKLPAEEEQKNKACPGTVIVEESSPGSSASPGTLSLDESLSPIKTPRRRMSADVQIQQSCQDQEGPAAKVLRKLPGRLVTVVEEKELIRRRRNRLRKLEAAASSSATVSPSNNSAQSASEPETSPSAKELPSLRDLPARRRIELESRAAAKEKDEGPRGEGLLSPSAEPVKRKRGRPPKNKSPEQPSPGVVVSQSLLEPTGLEAGLQSQAPEIQSHSDDNQASEEKVAQSQPKSRTSEQKAPKTSTPKSKSPKTKAESSENDSPAEKRRRGRPPKVRDSPVTSPVTSPRPSASEMLQGSAANPPAKEGFPETQHPPTPPSTGDRLASEVHESLEENPKITSVSKVSPKGQSRTRPDPKPRPLSKSTPKAQELLAVRPKGLPRSTADACDPPTTPPRTLSATETSPEEKEQSSSASAPRSSPTTAESPPKRKRGRPPKNSPSPCLEAVGPPAASAASEQETTLEKKTPVPPVCKRRRRRRKDDLGPSLPRVSQSSSEGEESRPLTRLALLMKREDKTDACPEGSAQPPPKDGVAEGLSSAESSPWEQPPSETPTRSTRLRPGSLVPPLEWENQRRKRRCSLEGSQASHRSRSPAPQAPPSEPEGAESESSLRSSSESNSSSQGARRAKRQCGEAKGRARGRGRHPETHAADRVLRSAAKPAEPPHSASAAAPARKAGSASVSATAGGAAGLPSPSTGPSPAAPVTSSLSNRGRKPKT